MKRLLGLLLVGIILGFGSGLFDNCFASEECYFYDWGQTFVFKGQGTDSNGETA